ncbi:hypothetical protein [Prosthecochloris sp.]|uniref:hypothetical protein n=1 Tax=Prosthecochloris sp. TaxID=290513 RepID=UPI0025D4EDD7|nr:hypothetical protein [Prosthecochloris sp.]
MDRHPQSYEQLGFWGVDMTDHDFLKLMLQEYKQLFHEVQDLNKEIIALNKMLIRENAALRAQGLEVEEPDANKEQG